MLFTPEAELTSLLEHALHQPRNGTFLGFQQGAIYYEEF
jgi:hypothetical protein